MSVINVSRIYQEGKNNASVALNFATDPDLFVLDEPTAGTDKASREDSIIYYITHALITEKPF